jgi:predicted aspartyl protease
LTSRWRINRRTLLAAGAASLVAGCKRRDEQAQRFPLIRRADRLFIGARVNGVPVEALLDSAAETSVADPMFAARARLGKGQDAVAHGTGARHEDAQLVPHVRLEAAGLTVPDASVAVIDLSDISKRLIGRRLEFILGRELFDAAPLVIDIAQGWLRPAAPGETIGGVRLPLVEERGNELIPVEIEGQNVRATFDLGNGSGVLVSKAFAAVHLSDGRAMGTKSGGGIGGAHDRKTLVLKSLRLGGRLFSDVSASIDESDTAADANIGVSLLGTFRILSDYPGRAVWLA